MEIKNHLLYVDGKQVQFRKSPNVGGKIKKHRFIINHYTAASTAESAISWMVAPQAKVSAHLHLDRNGVFVQLVPFDIIAWHAGQSEWKDVKGINSWSIGIEIQNTGTQEYTQAQLDALVAVETLLVKTYSMEEILGHSDIAPGRKTDPGKQFPMSWLRDKVFGSKTSFTTTANLNLREEPNTIANILATIEKGEKVNVIRKANTDWVEVFVCSIEKSGFVNKHYLI